MLERLAREKHSSLLGPGAYNIKLLTVLILQFNKQEGLLLPLLFNYYRKGYLQTVLLANIKLGWK